MGENTKGGLVTLRLNQRARRDLIEIAEYIAETNQDRRGASRFVDQLIKICFRLAQRPGTLGRARDELLPGLRSIAFKSYVIFFHYVEEDVEVVTIIHGARDIEAHFNDAQ